MQKLRALSSEVQDLLLRYMSPFVDLGIRLYVANDFFKSGWLKFQNYLNGNWDLTVSLFKEEYHVPLIPAEVAAVLGTGGELILSTLLAIGLLSRLTAFGLLFMVGIIEFTYGSFPENRYWALFLATILARGGGALSVDYLIKQFMILRK